jgi:hypothetical protein
MNIALLPIIAPAARCMRCINAAKSEHGLILARTNVLDPRAQGLDPQRGKDAVLSGVVRHRHVRDQCQLVECGHRDWVGTLSFDLFPDLLIKLVVAHPLMKAIRPA